MPKLECPICRRNVVYKAAAEIPFRPFCSRRCQMIDLGKWLNEDYRVSEELPPELRSDRPQDQPDPGADE